ncbi:hypothetical protein L486_05417 [Kwoniella mangroviensis CBS 10435]|uniref:PITH domain-containing protein n=1 Tax=Kwoniella mangroviensis CBS 10435 TaxID=1331196 RepID=A0A1B9IM49_9TREE|nr:hypothetical protein L486_05417 [Kwoniella mangroviensis CBS 10435]OCF75138.1 hypothetical protein I204_03987 [Kwoniella mangroviensis CBS 8886]
MSCADDLTADDLTNNVTTEVLERVTGGEGSNTNLWGQIDKDNVTGLNLEDVSSAPKVIKTWDERLDEELFVESGVDDDLILYIPFISSLRLRTLLLHPPAPGHPHRPGRLRLFANLPHCPDFSDLESMTPIMDIDISSPPNGTRRLPDGRREVEEWGLKVQKLANVFSIILYFSEAETSLRSTMFYVGFKGDPKTHTMDMSKLGQVPAQNAADKKIDEVADKKGSGYTTIR